MKFPKKINIYTSTDVKEIKLNWLYNSLGTVFNFQCHFVWDWGVYGTILWYDFTSVNLLIVQNYENNKLKTS